MENKITLHGELLMDAKVNKPLLNETFEGKSVLDDARALEDAQNQSASVLRNNSALYKEFGDFMPEIIKNLRMMNDAVVRNTQNLPALGSVKQGGSGGGSSTSSGNNIEKGLLQTINTGGNMLQSVENGNFGGAIVSGVNGASNAMGNLSQSANSSGLSKLGSLLGKASIATAIVGAAISVGKKFADSYQEAMPTIFGTGKAFGTTDNDLSMMLYHKVNESNLGTGLNNEEFNSLIVGLRQQGVGNGLGSKMQQAELAASIAATSSKWAYATGGDVNQFANFAGLMARYGNSRNVAEDFNYVMSAGLATGLNEGQLPEFLSSVEKIIEDGIAKGFTRSATEVADTMLMFSKLSGNNAFWQGEQGAKLLNQMNSGLASATGLSKTSDIIAYRAISQIYSDEESQRAALEGIPFVNGGSYVNKMMLLEQGLTKNNFGALLGGIYETTSNPDSQIERIRQMFGLNYTGASRVRDLYEEYKDKNYDTAFEEKLKNIQEAPENQNNETKWQQSVNKIQETMQDKGEGIYKGVLSIVEDTAYIADLLGGDGAPVRNDGTNGVTSDDLLRGKPAQVDDYDQFPRIKIKDKKSQRAYLEGDYGPTEYRDYIMNLVGNDENSFNSFLDYIFSSDSSEYDTLRRTIADETADGTSSKWERERTGYEDWNYEGGSVTYWLEALYKLWSKLDSEGIEMH